MAEIHREKTTGMWAEKYQRDCFIFAGADILFRGSQVSKFRLNLREGSI